MDDYSTTPSADMADMHMADMRMADTPMAAHHKSSPSWDTNSPMLEPYESTKQMATPAPTPGHQLSPTDPENPMNWPLGRKIYASFVSFAFAFVV